VDLAYLQKINYLETSFSKYAKHSTESLGRIYDLPDDPFRTPFQRDCHRVLHSLPFRRLKHKTQVFFSPRDDHICTRMEHSLHVASIASTICIRLALNNTLAEAIALAHDLGHPPFGHLGEKAMARIYERYSRSNRASRLPLFQHEVQSLRVIDHFKNSLHERLNLTVEVRDGVVCHCGEILDKSLKPQYRKNIKSSEFSAKQRKFPATLEGCVVRMSDAISYLGRDYEDAIMAHLVDGLPKSITSVLGDTNSGIIGTLVNDLVDNSSDLDHTSLDHLQFSDNIYNAMKEMKDFNYDNIYLHPKLKGQEERIFLILNELFNYFLETLNDNTRCGDIMNGNYYSYPCEIFATYLKDIEYSDSMNKGRVVGDFIAGMTDNFALYCFENLFYVHAII